MPKVFTAQFSDLSGSTNPSGIWSPSFIALKQALDRGDTPENVLQALYAWLSRKNIEPSKVDRILELEPSAAVDALLALVGAGLNRKSLPPDVEQTLGRAVAQIARQYVAKGEAALAKERERLQQTAARHGVGEAQAI